MHERTMWEQAEARLAAAKVAYAAAAARTRETYSAEDFADEVAALEAVESAESAERAAMLAAAAAGDHLALCCVGQSNRLAAEYRAQMRLRGQMIDAGEIYVF